MKLIDISGNKYGKLTVVSRNGRDSTGKTTWNCICECGNDSIAVGLNLKNGNTKSCGCNNHVRTNRFHDLSGLRFGRLIVSDISFSDKKHTHWVCKCDCGNDTTAIGTHLIRSVRMSCGCMRKENGSKRWKPGRTFHRKYWARKITEDAHCLKCGCLDNLHAHHIVPVSLNSHGKLDFSNGVSLCADCHRLYHSTYKLKNVNEETLCDFIGWSGPYRDFMNSFVMYKHKGGIKNLEKTKDILDLLIALEYEKGAD